MQTKRPRRETKWQTLVSFFPANWKELATETRANVRVRGFRSVAAVMRMLLVHVARGYSLRETVVRARLARVATGSDVALWKRVRSAEEWLRTLWVALLQAQGIEMPQAPPQLCLRLVDSTTIKAPGKTGSLWRVPYSFRVPEWRCAAFTLTPPKGMGTGESVTQVPLAPGDPLLAARGYCQAKGIEHGVSTEGASLVRLNTAALPRFTPQGRRVPLVRRLAVLRQAGQIGEWAGHVHGATRVIAGRLWASRKTEAALKRAVKQRRRHASRDGEVRQPETLEYAKYLSVFTTFDPLPFSAAVLLQWSRVRWPVALAFTRLKSLAQLGHLPKGGEQSARAWRYGKLVIAVLTEQLIRRGQFLAPCRPTAVSSGAALPLARVCVRPPPDSAGYRTGAHVTVRADFVASDLPRVKRAAASAQNAGVGIPIFLQLALMLHRGGYADILGSGAATGGRCSGGHSHL